MPPLAPYYFYWQHPKTGKVIFSSRRMVLKLEIQRKKVLFLIYLIVFFGNRKYVFRYRVMCGNVFNRKAKSINLWNVYCTQKTLYVCQFIMFNKNNPHNNEPTTFVFQYYCYVITFQRLTTRRGPFPCFLFDLIDEGERKQTLLSCGSLDKTGKVLLV